MVLPHKNTEIRKNIYRNNLYKHQSSSGSVGKGVVIQEGTLGIKDRRDSCTLINNALRTNGTRYFKLGVLCTGVNLCHTNFDSRLPSAATLETYADPQSHYCFSVSAPGGTSMLASHLWLPSPFDVLAEIKTVGTKRGPSTST